MRPAAGDPVLVLDASTRQRLAEALAGYSAFPPEGIPPERWRALSCGRLVRVRLSELRTAWAWYPRLRTLLRL